MNLFDCAEKVIEEDIFRNNNFNYAVGDLVCKESFMEYICMISPRDLPEFYSSTPEVQATFLLFCHWSMT